MRDKFNELFPYALDFDSARHNTLMQNRYDELGKNQIEYIENATLHHADMYEMLESKLDLIRCGIGANYSGDPKENPKYLEVVELLKRARGE
ncbi:MAG: hypothetical protein GY928_28450 [Colwellia sp.]|nr:hypothetical protein [Colwellia sp.]